jgi:aspartyl protease family protein
MRQLLFACIVIAVTAAAAPGLFTRYMAGEGGAVSPAEEAAPAGSGSSPVSARQVEIEAERDGHFYVDAEINFRPVRLMVDTGATVIALRQSDAAAAGIRPRRADFEHPVQTANGTAYAAAASLDSVAVRDIEVSGVRALILPDDKLSMSLLGGSFLNRLARFEVADGTLIFEN